MRKTLITITALTLLLLAVAAPAQAFVADSFFIADSFSPSSGDATVDEGTPLFDAASPNLTLKGDSGAAVDEATPLFDAASPKIVPKGDVSATIDTGASRCLIVIVC